MAPSTLLVDYGGVLTTSLPSCLASWLAAEDVDPNEFAAVLAAWRADAAAPNPVHGLETGALETADFERILAAALRRSDGGPVRAAGLLERMFAGFAPEPMMTALLRALRAAGVRIGLVSNSWGNSYPRTDWDQLFDTVVISGEVGLRKPQPEIYLLAAQRLGVAPEHCVFVDDLMPNVRGAVAVGMVGVHHVDESSTRAELSALFALPL